MKTQTLTALLFLLVIPSCKQTSKTRTYQLVKAEKELTFPLDDNTKSSFGALFPYTDKDGKEYLTFKVLNRNEFLFYNMLTGEPEIKINVEREGSNGVGRISGYYLHNMDSIFLTVFGTQFIYLIDSTARVKEKYDYNKTSDETPLLAFSASSDIYKPMILLDRKLYIPPSPNRKQKINPLCAVIDVADKSVHGLDVPFPKFSYVEADIKDYGAEANFSRCFDGKQFAYSFYYDENIYITDMNHTTIRKAKAKSKHIPRVEYLNDYNATVEEVCRNPNYGNMIYDKYRDVYYRVAYPKAEIEKDVRPLELIHYGRKTFSLVILDKDFNVIGETKFPDYTYNQRVWFVREDGLYISASHFMNPDYSDDWLVFHRFDLVEKKE